MPRLEMIRFRRPPDRRSDARARFRLRACASDDDAEREREIERGGFDFSDFLVAVCVVFFFKSVHARARAPDG
jgi:hypothetical protein